MSFFPIFCITLQTIERERKKWEKLKKQKEQNLHLKKKFNQEYSLAKLNNFLS
jgi:hypothetical protein